MRRWSLVFVLSSFAPGCDEGRPPETPDRVAAARPAATPEALPFVTTYPDPAVAPTARTPAGPLPEDPAPPRESAPSATGNSLGALERSAPPSGCACASDAGGFDLAIACGAESCVDHELLRCDTSAHLSRGGSCGGPACGCLIEDASSPSTLELGCGLRVCLNGGVVECSVAGQVTRGGACAN